MSYVNLAIAVKSARANAINQALGSNATLSVYTGGYPASPDATATGTLLGICTCASGTFGTVVSGVLTATLPITQGIASNTGTAGWARLSTSAGVGIIDGDVGVANAAIVINTVSIASGGPIQVTSATFSEA